MSGFRRSYKVKNSTRKNKNDKNDSSSSEGDTETKLVTASSLIAGGTPHASQRSLKSNPYQMSAQSFSQLFRSARKLIRRVGLAVSGDIEANRYILGLSYGMTGRFKHILNREKKNESGSDKSVSTDVMMASFLHHIPSYYHYGMPRTKKTKVSSDNGSHPHHNHEDKHDGKDYNDKIVVQYREDWEQDHVQLLKYCRARLMPLHAGNNNYRYHYHNHYRNKNDYDDTTTNNGKKEGGVAAANTISSIITTAATTTNNNNNSNDNEILKKHGRVMNRRMRRIYQAAQILNKDPPLIIKPFSGQSGDDNNITMNNNISSVVL